MNNEKEKLIFFNADHAAKYGVNEAILLNYLSFWIGLNKENGINNISGKTWTYFSRESLIEKLPFFSEQNIKTVIKNLIKAGLIVKGNFNKKAYDKTNWYAFVDESQFIICKKALVNTNQWIGEYSPMDGLNLTNGLVNTNQPIPFNKPINKEVNEIESNRDFEKEEQEFNMKFCDEDYPDSLNGIESTFNNFDEGKGLLNGNAIKKENNKLSNKELDSNKINFEEKESKQVDTIISEATFSSKIKIESSRLQCNYTNTNKILMEKTFTLKNRELIYQAFNSFEEFTALQDKEFWFNKWYLFKMSLDSPDRVQNLKQYWSAFTAYTKKGMEFGVKPSTAPANKSGNKPSVFVDVNPTKVYLEGKSEVFQKIITNIYLGLQRNFLCLIDKYMVCQAVKEFGTKNNLPISQMAIFCNEIFTKYHENNLGIRMRSTNDIISFFEQEYELKTKVN